jgi:hypothetical protein
MFATRVILTQRLQPTQQPPASATEPTTLVVAQQLTQRRFGASTQPIVGATVDRQRARLGDKVQGLCQQNVLLHAATVQHEKRSSTKEIGGGM